MTLAKQTAYLQPTSPDAIRRATFEQTKHGYDPNQVRDFLTKLAGHIEAYDADRAELHAQVSGLREEVARLREAAAPSHPSDPMEISVKAVNLLSQAQQAADSCVAEAEQYARDLIETAREQYREILQRAQNSAAQAVRDLPVAGAAAPGTPAYTQPVAEIEYVRTFARVAQVQLRSVLDALTSEVDKLGQLPQLPDAPEAGTAHRQQAPREQQAQVSWLPNLAAPPPGYQLAVADEPMASGMG